MRVFLDDFQANFFFTYASLYMSQNLFQKVSVAYVCFCRTLSYPVECLMPTRRKIEPGFGICEHQHCVEFKNILKIQFWVWVGNFEIFNHDFGQKCRLNSKPEEWRLKFDSYRKCANGSFQDTGKFWKELCIIVSFYIKNQKSKDSTHLKGLQK